MNITDDNLLIIKNDSKRVRKSTAIKLPPEITESMIPKYVVYYKECYNRDKMLFREFFKIEKHPKIKKVYTSSKSNKVSILSKLEQIKEILKNIDNNDNNNNDNDNDNDNDNNNNDNNKDNNVKKEKIVLPKYISIKKHEKENNKYYLIYDKKISDSRESYKLLCDSKLSISENLEEFIKKINNKYNICFS